MKGMDETEMLEALPIRLRQDVQYFLNRDLIANLPLLHGMDDRIVLTVSQRLRREVSPSLLASAGVTVWSHYCVVSRGRATKGAIWSVDIWAMLR
eukprot:SAG25_NODE_317_length_9961_cov_5.088724_5_plen_95_part_00